MTYLGLHSKEETDRQLKPMSCSFHNSTDSPLHGADADHTLGGWPISSPGRGARIPGIFSSQPPFCLPDFWNQWANSSFREHVHVSCQAARAASDSPNITVCIIRQLPAELVFIIWLTTRDNDYFSFPGKTNIAAFSFQHQRWCSLAFYQLKDFFFKKKMLVVLPHISLTLQSPMASVCSELSCWD